MTESCCPKCKRYFRNAPMPTTCPLCFGPIERSNTHIQSTRREPAMRSLKNLTIIDNGWDRP